MHCLRKSSFHSVKSTRIHYYIEIVSGLWCLREYGKVKVSKTYSLSTKIFKKKNLPHTKYKNIHTWSLGIYILPNLLHHFVVRTSEAPALLQINSFPCQTLEKWMIVGECCQIDSYRNAFLHLCTIKKIFPFTNKKKVGKKFFCSRQRRNTLKKKLLTTLTYGEFPNFSKRNHNFLHLQTIFASFTEYSQ